MSDRIITGSAIIIGNSTIKGKINKQVDPPITLNLIIVGDNAPIGDIRAGKYTLLDLDTMKQVVGTQDEVTDEYKEYFGPILWSLSGLNGHLENNLGTETYLSISASGSFVVSASCRGNLVNLTVNPTFQQSTYLVSSFADLQEIERCVNNDVESTCTLQLASGVSYIPINGDGFAGAVFRLTSDIDFNNRGLFIGRVISGNLKPFKASFNGAWYSFKNIGGTYSENDRNDTLNTCFIARIYGGRLDNLYVYGSVTNNATSKLLGCIVGGIDGATTVSIRNIYTDININATSSSYSKSAPIFGWLTANSTLTNCVSAGTNVSYDRPVGFTLGTVTANSCITVGKLVLYLKRSGSIIVDLNSSSSIANYCASLSTHEIKNGTAYEYINAAGPNTYSYEAISKAANGSRWLMCNNGYNNVALYSLNNMENGTVKTKAQLQSGSLFNRQEWLEVAGFYPVPRNNPFITEAKVLAKVHQ